MARLTACPPGPAGEVDAVSEGVGVLRAADAFPDRQQGGALVAGCRSFSRQPGRDGEVVANGECRMQCNSATRKLMEVNVNGSLRQ
jgi:hypothetical protein